MRMECGAYVSSNVSYGYRLTNNLPEVYEPEDEEVHRIILKYIMGRGSAEIAKGLTQDGNLRNEHYIGDMFLQKYCNL